MEEHRANVVDAAPAHGPNRRVVLRALLGTALGLAGAIVSWLPFWATEAATGVINAAVAASFASTSAVLALAPDQRRTAWAIGAAAAFYLTSWWWAWPPDWQVGPLPIISFVLGYLWFALGGLALVQYPGRVVERPVERYFFASMVGWICGGKLLLATVSTPASAGFAGQAWWPTVVDDPSVFGLGSTVFNIGLVVHTLGLLGLLVAKVARAERLEVVDAVPAVVAAGTVAVCGAVYLGARVLVVPAALQDQLRIVVAIAALATPLAFLTAVLRRTLVRSTVAARVPRIARSARGELEQELRRALWDPDLKLWLSCPERGGYVDADGREGVPDVRPGRWLVEITASSGNPTAALVTTRTLERFPEIVESVTGAVALALERQAQLEETVASRARINDAELTARRNLRRDIHDGVQQHLLTVKTRLRIASLRIQESGDGQEDAVERAREALDDALDAFGELTRGSFPPLLASGGLAAAVPGVVARLDLDAEIVATERRFDSRIEQHLYTVVSEALTNVHKYAPAARAIVRISYAEGWATVEVRDDGPGGANTAQGTGLAGIADRVHALEGHVTLTSPPGGGTRIEVTVPCA